MKLAGVRAACRPGILYGDLTLRISRGQTRLTAERDEVSEVQKTSAHVRAR